MTRLTTDSMNGLSGVKLPAYDRDTISNGILHIGSGNFHRAHQAVYIDDILELDSRWGIIGASLFSPATRDRLKPQDFLYSVCERSADSSSNRIIGAVKDVLCLADQRERIIATISSPEIKVVTLTITEKGYCHTLNGELDDKHPDIQHDLLNPESARSLPGVLAAGLQARKEAVAGPLNVISCDNLSRNGKVLQQVMRGYITDPALADWCEANLSFPETMVDRIVPQPTEADRVEFRQAFEIEDEALLVCEPFRQWVIEDRFVTERPPWQEVGVQIVDDVAEFEMVKLRMLNATHSALAYLGLLCGYEYIHETMRDETLASFADYLLRCEVIPNIDAPASLDLAAYKQSVLERFANSEIAYGTAQVATDGSKKLPQRIFSSLIAAQQENTATAGLCLVVSAWLRCMSDPGIAVLFSDPAKRSADFLAASGADDEIVRLINASTSQLTDSDIRSQIRAIIAGR